MADKEPKKIRILAFCDSPRTITGFGRVSYGIFDNLYKTGKYDITFFGINDMGGWQDPAQYPYPIYPAMLAGVQGDFYGRVRLVNVIRGADIAIKPGWDIIFILQDPFILEDPIFPDVGLMDAIKDLHALYRKNLPLEHWWNSVAYWPIDSSVKENWVEHAIGLADNNVAYTEYGKREILKANEKLDKPIDFSKMQVIYHGVDTKTFMPIDELTVTDFKKKFFAKVKIDIENTFIVGVVARNQMRKDLPRVMKIFKEFQKRRPDSMLYIHAKQQDSWGSLDEYARAFKLELGKDWMFPGNFSENLGYPADSLNLIYNSMDVNLTATHGEGFGLPIFEAMAAKTLNMAPNITSIPELFGTENKEGSLLDIEALAADETIRGIPLMAASTSSEWTTFGPSDYERIRPITNVDDAVKKLIWVYDHPDEAAKITDRAYEWVQQFTWEKIASDWDGIFQKVYNDLEQERKTAKEELVKAAKENAVNKDSNKSDSDQLPISQRDESGKLPKADGEHKTIGPIPLADSSAVAGQEIRSPGRPPQDTDSTGIKS
jgi:glycosyltransferase involved in cell wall biosynthesis